jgi:hypothetical protein
MKLEKLASFANVLDGMRNAHARWAANAIDMAINEASNSEDPFNNARKELLVYANILDADGECEAADFIDLVLSKTAESVEDPYGESNHKDSLIHALVVEHEKVEPIRSGFSGAAYTLSTRNSPEYPGVMMARVSDGVYQDLLTKKVYDFNKGWTDDAGGVHAGGTVANQSQLYNKYLHFPQIFEGVKRTSRPK